MALAITGKSENSHSSENSTSKGTDLVRGGKRGRVVRWGEEEKEQKTEKTCLYTFVSLFPFITYVEPLTLSVAICHT